jgi:hypothetical protein
MKTTTISALSISAIALTATTVQANSITADSQAWSNDGLTVEVGASQRQFNVEGIKPVHKVREVHVPLVPAYTYHDAHGREVHVPEVPGYNYHENYTVYEKFTKNVGRLSSNAKVVGKVAPGVILGAGFDNRLYATAAVKVDSLVASGGVNTSGNYHVTLAYSPFKNVALIAHNQKEFTAIGTQVQLGGTSIQVAYAPAVQGWSFGIGQEVSTKQPTFQATKIEEPIKAANVAPKVVKAISVTPVKKSKPLDLNQKFIRGRG